MRLKLLPITALILGLCTAETRGQASYSGKIGTLPIELALDASSDDAVEGTYLYTKFGTPIELRGSLKNKVLTLTETDGHGKATARLTIPAFASSQPTLAGTWQNLATGQKLPLALTQQFVLSPGQDTTLTCELLQTAALPTCYFKVAANSYASISSVKLYEKKTGRLVQQLKADCELRGLRSVSVGDFNFDGLADFAVFEQGFAGPNTASLYFLYNPATKRYVPSGFSGTSLQFDAKTKRIHESNSCCAGSSVQNNVYKVVNNRMVLVEQHCYRWDEKKQALVERKVSACQ